jgi:RimJ/RimL family protein N-acetyltransferase
MLIDGKTYLSFETERLIIRPCSTEDATFIYELLNCTTWLQYIGDRNVNSIHEARNYIEDKMYPQLKRLGFGNYTVIRKSDQQKMGTCGLHDREGLPGVDIGFAFLPQYEGVGYAYEAALEIKNQGFECFGLNQINAITLPSNKRSRKLLEKLGLQFEKLIQLPGDSEQLMFYTVKAKFVF